MSGQKLRLNIAICGAGLGGLSAAIACSLAGHDVQVFESAKELTEIGAGLQITPNGARLLRSWGLGDKLDGLSAVPTTCTVHRYTGGKILALEEDFDKKLKQKFGEPFHDMHRADLQKILYQRAKELGVQVHLNRRVIDVIVKQEAGDPIVVVFEDSGEDSGKKEEEEEKRREYTCDLVIGADGLRSKCRERLLQRLDEPLPTGDLAYRIVLTLDQLEEDQELKRWVSKPAVHFWIGDSAHVVGYSMKSGTMYNIVLLCPDDLPNGVSRQSGSVDEMKTLFDGWDPVLTKFLACVKSVEKWRLMHRDALETWSNKDKNFVLMGDACHPMLPYLAQGANSSLEDGAVLGRVLEFVSRKDQLASAIDLYEKLRKERGEAIAVETFKQREVFHLPNGPEQVERDRNFESQLGHDIKSPFPSRWTDPDSQNWLYGYDAYHEADRALKSSGMFQSGLK